MSVCCGVRQRRLNRQVPPTKTNHFPCLFSGSSGLLVHTSPRVWQLGHAFMFGDGRSAAFILNMKPHEITEKDAVAAFLPYLDEDSECRTVFSSRVP